MCLFIYKVYGENHRVHLSMCKMLSNSGSTGAIALIIVLKHLESKDLSVPSPKSFGILYKTVKLQHCL